MHLFESWYCKPKFNIAVHPKIKFTAIAQKSSVYSIYLFCETEVNTEHNEFSYATGIFGHIKQSLLYPMQTNGKHMFLVIPTQSEPKKLSTEPCGKAHIACHFGSILAQAILALPLANNIAAEFCIILSDRLKNLIKCEEQEFLLGVLQRSVSTQIKKSSSTASNSNHKYDLLFCSESFSESNLQHAKVLSKSMSITRSLINMPANILNPKTYEDCIRFFVKTLNISEEEISASEGISEPSGECLSEEQNEPSGECLSLEENESPEVEIKVFDYETLQQMGCNLICAVGKGSRVPPRIIKLSYHPKQSTKHIALVGKGITFDSGGYNIKPGNSMRYMKKDMGGSAAAIGVFFSCVNLQLPIRLTCYLAIAENMVSGNAMRPGDIYKAHNGINVEIDNTDAEGRLVLADALSLASAAKPDWLIDLATLTGSARAALGPLIDSAFGNRTSFNQLLDKMSQETGDWIWNIPLPQQYETYFSSHVADITNSANTPYAGSLTAALFLQKFVNSCAWSHIDTFMWCDKAQGLWGESNAPTAKCVRLMVRAIKDYCFNDAT